MPITFNGPSPKLTDLDTEIEYLNDRILTYQSSPTITVNSELGGKGASWHFTGVLPVPEMVFAERTTGLALASGVNTIVTSLVVPGGWIARACGGLAIVPGTVNPTTNYAGGGLSAASGLPDLGLYTNAHVGEDLTVPLSLEVPERHFDLTGQPDSTLNLVVNANFSAGDCTVVGWIRVYRLS